MMRYGAMIGAVSLLMSCSTGSTTTTPAGEETTAAQGTKPWTLDEAKTALCEGKAGCEVQQTWGPAETGRADLYVVQVGLAPESEADSCERSEVVRIDLRTRKLSLLARSCPEGQVTETLELTGGQLKQTRTAGAMWQTHMQSFTYDVTRARPVSRYHHEIVGGQGFERRGRWDYGDLRGFVEYSMICSGEAVEVWESAILDASLSTEADPAEMATWDWSGCASPLDGESSRVRLARVNARYLVMQWDEVPFPDDAGAGLGELIVHVGTERESLAQSGLICEAQDKAAFDDRRKTYTFALRTEGVEEVDGVRVTWARQGSRLTAVLAFPTAPQALALRLNTPLDAVRQGGSDDAISLHAPSSPDDALSTIRPHTTPLLGSPDALAALRCELVEGQPRVDFNAWAATREVQMRVTP